MAVQIIDKAEIPDLGANIRSPEVKQILGAFDTLRLDQSIKLDAGSKHRAKQIYRALLYYRNSERRPHTPRYYYPTLRVALRGNLVFCWKDE